MRCCRVRAARRTQDWPSRTYFSDRLLTHCAQASPLWGLGGDSPPCSGGELPATGNGRAHCQPTPDIDLPGDSRHPQQIRKVDAMTLARGQCGARALRDLCTSGMAWPAASNASQQSTLVEPRALVLRESGRVGASTMVRRPESARL